MYIADYSEILGGNILPFQIELDVPNCLFYPGPGAFQKFSYVITAKGVGGSEENLSYFILGIDENITINQLRNIGVHIDGSIQSVRLTGGNPTVSIVTGDIHTGASGLKFNYNLHRLDGVMHVSFQLTSAYGVKAIPICLYGTSTAKTGLTIGGPLSLPDEEPEEDDEKDDGKKCFDLLACSKVDHKVYTLSVPVSVKPFAIAQEPEITCVGELKSFPGHKECEENHEKFDFTISQKIAVNTPLEFGVKECIDPLCVEEEKDEEEEEKDEEEGE